MFFFPWVNPQIFPWKYWPYSFFKIYGKISLLYFILKGQKSMLQKNITVFYESRVGWVLGFMNWDMKQSFGKNNEKMNISWRDFGWKRKNHFEKNIPLVFKIWGNTWELLGNLILALLIKLQYKIKYCAHVLNDCKCLDDTKCEELYINLIIFIIWYFKCLIHLLK